jgi:riboflavin synthase
MFTGIVEGLGEVARVQPGLISIKTGLGDIKLGDSISINGACLTVTVIKPASKRTLEAQFDATPETISRTTLKLLRPGDKVNLERAMRADGRLGGHIMTGHVEDTGKLLELKPVGNSFLGKFSAPPEILRYTVAKGSIAVDGISFTVVEKTSEYFTVSIIPHTLENTTLKMKRPGDPVNLEPDILAKYVENAVHPGSASKLNKEFLKENGFL